ncbi:hypothetical protein QR680_017568 [Steinernema hermaphroditum]|uniref:6-phosphofructokinase n=1 Tax=Steinernema hermaphroditum TaxID=289476 RepID=A0AA39HH86_9BILA|nr:hypothetical protein QR680_017568 [Steinernema hermaphroditum]
MFSHKRLLNEEGEDLLLSFSNRLNKKLQQADTQDLIAMVIAFVFLPLGYIVEIFFVLPFSCELFSSEWTFRVLITAALGINAYLNMYKMVSVGPNGGNNDLPSIMKPGFKYCFACKLNTPPRAFHCPVCDVCIFRRDHHCSFVSVCVGHYNQRYFVAAVLNLWIACITVMGWNWSFMWTSLGGFKAYNMWQLVMPHLAVLFGIIDYYQFFCVMLFVFPLTTFLFVTYQLAAQVFCLIRGQTRMEYLLDIHAYQLGWRENLRASLGNRWFAAMISPFVHSHLESDGLAYHCRESGPSIYENVKTIPREELDDACLNGKRRAIIKRCHIDVFGLPARESRIAMDSEDEVAPLPGSGAASARERFKTRTDSIVPVVGKEGADIERLLYKGRCMAVLTSGGDSQGMNSAVRAVVRMGLYLGCKVYCIHEGYQGMVDGGDFIREADWNSVSDIIQRGGTIIGSARCKDFRERPGRLEACRNLITRGITHVVCIGGDGSLTGAHIFRQEWPLLIQELVRNGQISEGKAQQCPNIQIVGIVGSIDNDFCGADSALQRIIEATDAVVSTAQSHQRAFVVEVMGRHCGYLAVVSALASEADFCFIPEWPQPGNWPEILCNKLAQQRAEGQRLNIIIVAEGAIDREGNPISAELVRGVIKSTLHYDTRVTVLGHVQRGGSPSAFDRLLGCRMGAEATLALMEMTPESEPCVVSIDGNQMVRVPLMQCVQRTQEVQKAMKERDWERAVKLRGRSFQRNLETYRLLTKLRTPQEKDNLSGGKTFNFAVINVGSPAGGMNAAVRSFIRVGLYHHCIVYGIHNSFEGLINGEVKKMEWGDVNNWVMHGGSFLGTQKQLPEKNMAKIAERLEEFQIHALLLVGGFEAYHSCLQLSRARERYRALRIPMCVIPCTISNNMPGTSLSLGSDTAVNEICQMIDKIKQSATGTKRRVFIVETMGGSCGYLATLSALASGADNAYIYEEKFNVDDIKEDCRVIAAKMEQGVQRYLIIRNEHANPNYKTTFVEQLFAEEGCGQFSTRVNILGHAQQGGNPTPFDRNLGTKLAARALEFLLKQAKHSVDVEGGVFAATSEGTATLLGLRDRRVVFTPVEELFHEMDFENNLPRDQW